MAWYAGATRMELRPEAGQQPSIRPTQLIVHSIVAPWEPRRTYEYWRDSTSLESHFGLGYSGDLGQYLSTTTRADANAGANRRADGTGAISVETASNTKASDAWTEQQVEALIELGVWAHRTHGIPLRICRSATDPGFGWHQLHRAWSTSGTACPGAARIAQFKAEVFPTIVGRAAGDSTAVPTPDPPEQEDDMPVSDADVEKIAKAAARQVAIYKDSRMDSRDARQMWDDAASPHRAWQFRPEGADRDAWGYLTRTHAEVAALRAAVGELAAALGAGEQAGEQLAVRIERAITEAVESLDIDLNIRTETS